MTKFCCLAPSSFTIPRRGPVTIVGGDEAECCRRLKEIKAAGELVSHVRFIVTGVPRAESKLATDECDRLD